MHDFYPTNAHAFVDCFKLIHKAPPQNNFIECYYEENGKTLIPNYKLTHKKKYALTPNQIAQISINCSEFFYTNQNDSLQNRLARLEDLRISLEIYSSKNSNKKKKILYKFSSLFDKNKKQNNIEEAQRIINQHIEELKAKIFDAKGK